MTTGMTVNAEPSWIALANIAIMLIEDGEGEQGKEKGRELVREMGQHLADIRATQDNCPKHLRKGERWGPNRDA